ncbi:MULTISPECIES: helix-turn-helix domain-containing protein [unclassified Caballeronia]|uniref:helix-turn-helix domain-containing protein n=1 Tax=unclassified Caballeronia TaxID=2646786 RepID=UPI0028586296|nr:MULTISPECIES: helix-turn-helix domain-containing protein [unclassified Caballeronia]MDR5777432.1 helix-turn-helix domain-containing protein [Caballeronia sp. LZ002]MDR5852870.1 helix-turn-helix domain-containing protein [Caballeronia sp. LZ003]
MQIRILHRQGKSLRAIACEVGCSVNTVRKYLAAQDAPKFRPAATPRESILKPFEAYLRERIAAAAPDWIPATVLWREIQSKGFDGGERIVRKFVATLRPVPAPDPLVRFETAAGDQMQVDWVECRHRIRRCYQQRHRRADRSCASDSTTGCLRYSTRCPCTTS